MNEFDVMDEVEVPDQWDDILERSAVGGRVEPAAAPRRWLASGAIAAAVLAVTLVAGLVALDRSDDDDTITVDTGPAPATNSDLPVLACADGELAAGSIPPDARGPVDPLVVESADHPMLRWSWQVSGVDVSLDVPTIPWADEAWSSTEAVEGLDATLAVYDERWSERRSVIHVLGETGLAEPCDRYDVTVTGGSEEENRTVALDAARALEWEPIERPFALG